MMSPQVENNKKIENLCACMCTHIKKFYSTITEMQNSLERFNSTSKQAENQ